MATLQTVTFQNGQKMPLVGLGTYLASNEEELETAVNAALQAGYRHIDTAYMYANEHVIGRVLKQWLDSGKLKREELFIVTKLPPIGMTPEKVSLFLKKSLESLQLTYVDLYVIHVPFGLQFVDEDTRFPMKDGEGMFDHSTDLEAVWKALEVEVDAGRVKSLGISNFNEEQAQRIVNIARHKPMNHQYETHAYFQQKALRETNQKLGITVCAYAPFASPGRKVFYDSKGIKFESNGLLDDPVVAKIAKKYNKTTAQILLRFLTQQGVVVIPKSVTPARIQQNIQIFDIELTPEEMKELEELEKGSAGRTFDFHVFRGAQKHPEYPFKTENKINFEMAETITLQNGIKMPLVGLGTSQATNELEVALNVALEEGCRLIDTAYLYANEHIIGKVLRQWLDTGRLKREDLFIVTKLPPTGMRPEKASHFLTKSLESLQLTYVDLYLVHLPFGLQYLDDETRIPVKDGEALLDLDSDLEAVWKALEIEVDAGRVKSLGISNFSGEQAQRIVNIAKHQPVNHQFELHAYFQQKSLREANKNLGINVCAYAPLGSPGRTAKYEAKGVKFEPNGLLEDPVVARIATKYDKTPAQILLRFLTQQGIAVIPKSVTPARIRQNLQIFNISLTPEEMEELEALDKGLTGRTFDFKLIPGASKHPEYPFKVKY
ncbi:3-oxo-5-beta-steroid 4-dehydrogenase [Orchesella cincta]|uniref:3-oxo-5-beta-steroid 4-dehydrogenase n=1 Tax=Orchesella cincta TaxID=48709 RepID=A0A1D2MD99_ORCCI|nr:3-oxo-5-beta-steroid 4-dehydrogenase [Orchesella cincta]